MWPIACPFPDWLPFPVEKALTSAGLSDPPAATVEAAAC
jgi:hypothetical protein